MSEMQNTPEPAQQQPEQSDNEKAWKDSLRAAHNSGQVPSASFVRYLDFLDHAESNVYELSAFDVTDKAAIKDAGTWGSKAKLIAYARGRNEVLCLAQQGLGFRAEALYMISGRGIPGLGLQYASRNKWHVMDTHTTDEQILERRIMPFDLDPDRQPKGRSATDDEHTAALRAGKLLTCFLWGCLDRLGKSRTCVAYGPSGNGFHCLLAVSIPETPEVVDVYTELLGAVARRVRSWIEKVDVDLKLGNASRLLPLYGSKKCKGGEDPVMKIRHRWSYLVAQKPAERLTLDDLRALIPLTLEGLPEEPEKVEEAAPPSGAQKVSGAKSKAQSDPWQEFRDAIAAIPLQKILEHEGLIDPRGNLICPGHGEAAKGSDIAIIPTRSGRSHLLNCQHSRCAGKGNCPKTKGTNWTGVGVVVERRKCDPKTARDILAEAFNIPKPKLKGRPPEPPATTDELLCMADGRGIDIDGSDDPGAPELIDPSSTEAVTTTFSRLGRACTDQGNAERAFDLAGPYLGYLEDNTWLIWDGKRFEKTKSDVRIQALVKRVNRTIYAEAASTESASRKRLTAWAKKSEGARSISSTIRLLRDLVLLDEDDLDAHPELLNCRNGVVCLETGAVLPHDPALKLTQITRGSYDPDKPSKLMIAHLERCQPDPEVRAYLWRSMGYQITGLVREHYFELHTGSGKDDEEGRNGKGTFMNALSWAIGDYAGAPPRDLLAQKLGEFSRHPTGFMTVKKKRLCVTSEFERGEVLNVANVKILTGADPVVGRGMRQDFGDPFWPTHHLNLILNWLPKIPDTDESIWGRVRVVRWPVHLAAAQRKLDLLDRLRTQEQVDGIITLLVQGCLEWQRAGQSTMPPQTVLDDTRKYREGENDLGQFIDENLEKAAGSKVNRKLVYERYKAWCTESGKKPLSSNNFGKELMKRKAVEEGPGDKSGNDRFWLGVRLVDDVMTRYQADTEENDRLFHRYQAEMGTDGMPSRVNDTSDVYDPELEDYCEEELRKASGIDLN
jgi:P4 family phage/plasmid primase-like protien